MTQQKPTKKPYIESPDPLVVGAASCGGLMLALVGLVGGWVSFRLMRVNRNMDLPPALPAERYSFASSSAGMQSYYADREAQGTPLVLLHSINAAGSSYEMRPLFERYQKQRPVYALDLPGFGFSDRSNRTYSPALYVDAICEFMEKQVSNGPADVVALSLGSEFAAMAALKRPELFRSLTLISPSGMTAKKNLRASQQAAQSNSKNRVYSFLTIPRWGQVIYDVLSSRRSIRYFLKRSFAGPVDTGLQDYAYITAHQPGAKNAPLYFVSGRLFTPGILESAYTQLTLPALVLYDQDPNVRFDRLPELLTRPNWSAVRIAPTRGLPQFERPDETVNALNEFWAKQTPA